MRIAAAMPRSTVAAAPSTREPLGADLRLATLERVRRVFRGLEDVGERRDDPSRRRCRAWRARGAARWRRRRGRMGASRAARRRRRCSRPRSRGSRRRSPPAGSPSGVAARAGRVARQLVDRARASARRRPVPTRGRCAAGACSRRPRRRAPRRARAPSGSRRSRRPWPTRSMPAAISAKAGSLAIVALPRSARAARWSASRSGPHVAGGEQQRIELLDVLAGFEDEEVEKTRRGRHAGSDLVCKSGQRHEVRPGAGRRPSPRAARARPCRARRRSRARSRDVRC